jgi:LmbE family N-acetylglucosaminyl deacetylase
VLVISPHLDDGVFACGRWLALHPGSTVLTVFAGSPRDGARCTEWDAQCGFKHAEQAIAARRAEDRRALAMIDARPCWLEFTDSQYGETPTLPAVAHALAEVLRAQRPARVLYPLGLYHSDHRLVHEACRLALAACKAADAIAYEDALYRGLRGVLQQRLAALAQQGVVATPVEWDPAPPSTSPRDAAGAASLKLRAVAAYASQLRAFGPGGTRDLERPERGWRLERAHEEPGRA